MKRLIVTICGITMLMGMSSCSDNPMELGKKEVELETLNVNPKVQNLIQQARNGDTVAYKSLATCYRDGDGVGKSWLKALCMYACYCKKTGTGIDDISSFFEKSHPFGLITDILDSNSWDEETLRKIEQLKQLMPAEAKAIEAAKKAFSMEEATFALGVIREAEDEGSEIAIVLQALYYDNSTDKAGQEECLNRISQKYPFFNLLLGDVYADKYSGDEDFSNIQEAVKCYYKADACGMLTPRYANKLVRMYKQYEESGLLHYDEQEIERLREIANCKN